MCRKIMVIVTMSFGCITGMISFMGILDNLKNWMYHWNDFFHVSLELFDMQYNDNIIDNNRKNRAEYLIVDTFSFNIEASKCIKVWSFISIKHILMWHTLITPILTTYDN